MGALSKYVSHNWLMVFFLKKKSAMEKGYFIQGSQWRATAN